MNEGYAPSRFVPFEQNERVKESLQFATEMHQGQTRANGEPYIVHPVAVFEILLSVGIFDLKILISAILHDVIEDCGVRIWEITSLFGPEVAEIVWTVSKPEGLFAPRFKIDPTIQKHLSRREYVFRIKSHPDWKVLVLKLADVLHNARTLGGCSAAKVKRFKEKFTLYYIQILQDLENRSKGIPEARAIARFFRKEILRELEKYTHI